jgi:hypothetical protein
MEEVNRTDNTPLEEASAEFTSFNRLAALLISVPSSQIRAKLEDVKKRSGAPVTPAVPASADVNEEPNRTDPD